MNIISSRNPNSPPPEGQVLRLRINRGGPQRTIERIRVLKQYQFSDYHLS